MHRHTVLQVAGNRPTNEFGHSADCNIRTGPDLSDKGIVSFAHRVVLEMMDLLLVFFMHLVDGHRDHVVHRRVYFLFFEVVEPVFFGHKQI